MFWPVALIAALYKLGLLLVVKLWERITGL